jgi:NADH-quinone oxidoreductase subunit E
MSPAFTPEGEARFAAILERFGGREEGARILPALRLALEEFGALDADVRAYMAERLGLPGSRIEELVTFYSLLHETPRGRHTITVCRSLTCRLLGSDDLAARIRRAIGLTEGHTTRDGRFTLEEVECIGACDRAPACIVDGVLHGPLDGAGLDRIVGEIEECSGGSRNDELGGKRPGERT